MRLYLIRHAIAEPRTGRMRDSQRALTLRGRKRMLREVKALRRMQVSFDRLLHSPWVRAAETAELLRPLSTAPLCQTETLARPPDEALLGELDGESVAVVGHQPWLTELAAWLAFGSKELGRGIRLKKGGVLVLDGEPTPGGMVLAAQLEPKLLRALVKKRRLLTAA